jgi:hypothetical protein
METVCQEITDEIGTLVRTLTLTDNVVPKY